MKTILLLFGGLLFAQVPDVPTDAARLPDAPNTLPQAAPPALLDEDREGASKTLPAETSAPEQLRPTDAPRRVAPSTARLVPVHPPGTGQTPQELVRKMLTPPKSGALRGQEVTLLRMLAGTRSRAQQASLIDAYWNLSATVAHYHIALGEQVQLEQVTSVSDDDRTLYDAALAEVRVVVYEARLAAVEAQHRLAAARPPGTSDLLPLPADAPHVGDYQTRYETIFAGRPAPQARRLNDTLPISYQAIRARSRAIETGGKLLSLRQAAYKAQHADLAQVLTLEKQLHEQRHRFVEAIRQYNLRIAEYIGIVAPEGTDGTQLVGMLIQVEQREARPVPIGSDGLRSVLIQRSPARSAGPKGDAASGVVQTSGEEPLQPSEAASSPSKAKTDRKAPRDGFVPRRLPIEP